MSGFLSQIISNTWRSDSEFFIYSPLSPFSIDAMKFELALTISATTAIHGEWRTQLNLFLTMLIGGIWHGANFTFLLWGAYHDVILAPVPARRAFNQECPNLYYIGTSYGTYSPHGGGISDMLQFLYRGKVTNVSISAVGPLLPIQKALTLQLSRGSVVIWEIPFRYVKRLLIQHGEVVFREYPELVGK